MRKKYHTIEDWREANRVRQQRWRDRQKALRTTNVKKAKEDYQAQPYGSPKGVEVPAIVL